MHRQLFYAASIRPSMPLNEPWQLQARSFACGFQSQCAEGAGADKRE
jgi:hypothetical protein